MQQRLHRLAAALRRDQLLVGELAGAVIADAEIEQIPGKADARRGARPLHRGGRRGGNGAIRGEAEAEGIVAARAVARTRGQLGQQVELRHVELRRGGGFLHAALAVLGLVLDGARGRLRQAQRALDRLLPFKQIALRIGRQTLALRRIERTSKDGATAEQHDQRGGKRRSGKVQQHVSHDHVLVLMLRCADSGPMVPS